MSTGNDADDSTMLLDLDRLRRPSATGEAPAAVGEESDDTVVVAVGDAPKAPELRIGEYQIVKELGRGGWGTVYKALHPGMGRMVALKLLHESTGMAVKRFDREVHVQARLRHPHICPIFDAGVGPEGRPYLVMDYIEGQPLSKLLSARSLSDEALALLMAKVAHALHHAHLRGILHRDIKPDNILVDRAGQPFVVDFGIARDTEDESEALTRVGQVVGTPYYIAPEQVRGQALGPATDVWAMGVVMFMGLIGRPPFRGRNELDTLTEVLRSPLPPLTREGRPLLPELEAICRHCLEKEPTARYASAEALARDLERYVHDEPVSVVSLGLGGRTRRWWRRREWPITAAAFAALSTLVLSGAAGALLWGLQDHVPAADWPAARGTIATVCGVAAATLVALGVTCAWRLAPKPRR